ncbi:MAG: hypothetical protein WDM78_12025 [Puia sp.]
MLKSVNKIIPGTIIKNNKKGCPNFFEQPIVNHQEFIALKPVTGTGSTHYLRDDQVVMYSTNYIASHQSSDDLRRNNEYRLSYNISLISAELVMAPE